MKTLISSLLAGTLMVFSGMALADCPLNMPEEKLVECLTVEGSGENYQDYQQTFQSEMADMSEEAAAMAQIAKIDESSESPAALSAR